MTVMTVVVVDGFGEMCLVGWCLCNRVGMYISIGKNQDRLLFANTRHD